jgi:hypothetical protein
MNDEQEKSPPPGLPREGSDEFRKEGDPLEPILDEGVYETPKAAPGPAPARPKAKGDKAFILSVSLATLVLVGGTLVIYALSGGFAPMGKTGPHPEPAPRHLPRKSPPPPRDAALSGLSRGDLERLTEELRKKVKSLSDQKINLQLQVRLWKARVEPMDERYLEGVIGRYLSGTEDERQGARDVLVQRGGPIAEELLKVLESRAAEDVRRGAELEDWKKKAQAAIKSVLDLQVQVTQLKSRKALEESQEFYRLGYRQFEAGEWAKAVASLTRAVELNPGMEAGFNTRGLARFELGKYDAALRDFERAADLNPGSPDFHLNRGRALAELGKKRLALKAAEKALEIKPGFVEAMKFLRELEQE